MNTIRRLPWLVLLLIGCLAFFFLHSLGTVPFHPDESSWIYMSKDFEAWTSRPASLAYDPQQPGSQEQVNREIGAPLTKYVIGLGRALAGMPALQADWDWSKSWEENRLSGALPSPGLLLVGRLSVALLLPLGLLFLYFIGTAVGNQGTGLLAALFLGLNALILLHNRRAMTEGVLTFCIILALWSLVYGARFPWLAGTSIALAFNAKQYALVLLPVGLLATVWPLAAGKGQNTPCWLRVTQFAGAFILLTLALNPIFWKNPWEAARSAWVARQDLLQRQVKEVGALMPGQILDTPEKRLASLVINLFIAPPAFAEVSNYRDNTLAAETQYLAVPGHNLGRGLAGGLLALALTLAGFFLAVIRAPAADPPRKRALILLSLATVLLAAVNLVAIPLSWQRYVIPLVPCTCLWAAYGLSTVITSKSLNFLRR